MVCTYDGIPLFISHVSRFMAYTWTNSVGKPEEAMAILKAGMEANPTRSVTSLNIKTYVG